MAFLSPSTQLRRLSADNIDVGGVGCVGLPPRYISDMTFSTQTAFNGLANSAAAAANVFTDMAIGYQTDLAVAGMGYGYGIDIAANDNNKVLGKAIDPFSADETNSLPQAYVEGQGTTTTLDTVEIEVEVDTTAPSNDNTTESAVASTSSTTSSTVATTSFENTSPASLAVTSKTIDATRDTAPQSITARNSNDGKAIDDSSYDADFGHEFGLKKDYSSADASDGLELSAGEMISDGNTPSVTVSTTSVEASTNSLVSNETTASSPGEASSPADSGAKTSDGAKAKAGALDKEGEGEKTKVSVNSAKGAQDASSKVFVGSNAGSENIVAARASSTPFEMLTSHLSPIVTVAQTTANLAANAMGAGAPKVIISPAANGVTHVTVTTSRDGMPFTMHFVQNATGLQFSGVQLGGRSMGATLAGSMALPVPTFCPGGGIRDGMCDMGAPDLGDASFALTEQEESDLELEDQLANLALDQIRMGTDPRGMNKTLRQVNAYLYNNDYSEDKRSISAAVWRNMLKRAIGLAIRSVPIFDEKGLRTNLSIQNDVISVVGMDMPTFISWESLFDTDLLEEQLLADLDDEGSDSFHGKINEHLSFGLKKRLPAIAKLALNNGYIDPALGIDGEANLQWGLATVSAIEDSEKKINTALHFLRAIHRSNKNAACKGIALVIRHSELTSRRKTDNRLFDRWNEGDVSSLIKETMMSDIWEIMGHRALRKHFTDDPEINRFLNEAVFSANYAKALRDLSKIDVTKVPEEDFWAAVEDTGVEEIILNNVLARMANHN